MVDSLEHKITRYLNIYNDLNKKLNWHAQSQILMMIPLVYILNDVDFDLDEFIEMSNYIKDESGFFSPLHSHQRFPTAAILICKFKDPKSSFGKLMKYQERLIDKGFKDCPYLAISALALMTTDTHSESEDLECRLDKAIELYKGMKSNHFFLTSHSDYPTAILLSQHREPVGELMEEIEYYYDKLSERCFKKGNELQLLSHILMMAKMENRDFIIDRCCELYNSVTSQGLKVKRLHYSQIGLMSVIDADLSEEIQHIKEATEILSQQKGFRWNKHLNLMISIIIVISEVLENMHHDITIIETGISTCMETLIEAQNAALIAAIASTSAVTTASGGN